MTCFIKKFFRRQPTYDGLQKLIKKLQKYRPLFKPQDPSQCMDRPFIDDWVRHCSQYITGDVLEFSGSSMYALKYAADKTHLYTATCGKNSSLKADFYFDIENDTTLPDKKFDCIICTQVLNYTLNPVNSVINLKKMLKNGGYMIITVPGTWGPHCANAPFTYNYSLNGILSVLKNSFEEAQIIEYKCFGNFRSLINTALWVQAPQDMLREEQDDFCTSVIGVLVKD